MGTVRFLAQSTVQLVRYAQQLSWVKVKIFNDLPTDILQSISTHFSLKCSLRSSKVRNEIQTSL